MPFVVIRVDLEIIVLSEVSQTKTISYDIVYMWNLKSDRNELIYKIEADHRLKLKPKAQIYGFWGKGQRQRQIGSL